MAKPDEYRRLAAPCSAMARRSTDPRARGLFSHIAEVWIKLADAEDRLNSIGIANDEDT
jgi:hypothetical protein